jgi:hypothetical protein
MARLVGKAKQRARAKARQAERNNGYLAASVPVVLDEPHDVGAQFYHGGRAGLQPGGYILSPAERGAQSATLVIAARSGVLEQVRELYDPGRVYVCDSVDWALAFAFARFGPRAAVYQVEPAGTVERDPDYEVTYHCERARIIGMVPVQTQIRRLMEWHRRGRPGLRVDGRAGGDQSRTLGKPT